MSTLPKDILFELKTQLTSLMGLTQVTLDGELSTEQRDNVEGALQLTYDIARIIDSLLESDLPALSQPLPLPQIDPEDEFQGKPPLKVLLVEDNPVNQKVLEKLLMKRGHIIDIVEDGEAAVPRAAAGHYDVILMDLQLPGIDGAEALQKFRREEGQHHPGRYTPVAALSASNMKHLPDSEMEFKFDDYLPKPVKLESLLRSLYYCREERYRDP